MPLSKYFSGKGESVMADMVKRYGPKKGKSAFYATANKQDMSGRLTEMKKQGRFKKRKKSQS